MLAVVGFLDRIIPDMTATIRRFPLVILLMALASMVTIIGLNDWVFSADDDIWFRWACGLSTGAMFVLAGYYFIESRPKAGLLGLVLLLVVPGIVIILFQQKTSDLIVLPLLPVLAILWLSVSPVTFWGKGQDKQQQQKLFWWINHRAVVSAAIAFVVFIFVGLGIFAVERALAVLFGLQMEDVFYQIILPFVWTFLVPFYWVSTLPKHDEFDETSLNEPDFLSHAIGFVGQFVLTPLLIIYALILYAYAVQIAFVQALPKGTLGWMVLVFTAVGAANMLVLFPPFMNQRALVRLFRRYWFLLTLLPLALYAFAVGERIDTYGLTAERVLLIAGGVWALALAVIFIVPHWADIRFIPAVAGVILTFFAVGPFNLENVAIAHQVARLQGAMQLAGYVAEKGTLEWQKDSATIARGSIEYLVNAGDKGARLKLLLADFDIPQDKYELTTQSILNLLAVPESDIRIAEEATFVSRDAEKQPVNIAQTPNYYGEVYLYTGSEMTIFYGLSFQLADNLLTITEALSGDSQIEPERTSVDLDKFVSSLEGQTQMPQPYLDFELAGKHYRLVVQSLNLSEPMGMTEKTAMLSQMTGQLFVE